QPLDIVGRQLHAVRHLGLTIGVIGAGAGVRVEQLAMHARRDDPAGVLALEPDHAAQAAAVAPAFPLRRLHPRERPALPEGPSVRGTQGRALYASTPPLSPSPSPSWGGWSKRSEDRVGRARRSWSRRLSRPSGALQCVTLFENRLITTTPPMISPRPMMAGPSSFCLNRTRPISEISTTPSPLQIA